MEKLLEMEKGGVKMSDADCRNHIRELYVPVVAALERCRATLAIVRATKGDISYTPLCGGMTLREQVTACVFAAEIALDDIKCLS
jgi:hypothetical protein